MIPSRSSRRWPCRKHGSPPWQQLLCASAAGHACEYAPEVRDASRLKISGQEQALHRQISVTTAANKDAAAAAQSPPLGERPSSSHNAPQSPCVSRCGGCGCCVGRGMGGRGERSCRDFRRDCHAAAAQQVVDAGVLRRQCRRKAAVNFSARTSATWETSCRNRPPPRCMLPRGGWIRVRVEIMGSQKRRIVGKSQSVLMMIDPMIFTRPHP
eukprot:COSAG01_NODE_1814_length_9172_cov_220.138212_10_plen_212_part_00